MKTETRTISVPIQYEHEHYNRWTFQADGYFLPAMTDAQNLRREWQGDDVFIGSVFWTARDTAGNITDRQQILRIIADTEVELQRRMGAEIERTLLALFAAQQIQSLIHHSYERGIREHTEFVEWATKVVGIESVDGQSTTSFARSCIFHIRNQKRDLERAVADNSALWHKLGEFLASNLYAAEIAAGRHEGVNTSGLIMRYLRAERNRLSRRAQRFIRAITQRLKGDQ